MEGLQYVVKLLPRVTIEAVRHQQNGASCRHSGHGSHQLPELVQKTTICDIGPAGEAKQGRCDRLLETNTAASTIFANQIHDRICALTASTPVLHGLCEAIHFQRNVRGVTV